jgi:hypothetical protein
VDADFQMPTEQVDDSAPFWYNEHWLGTWILRFYVP